MPDGHARDIAELRTILDNLSWLVGDCSDDQYGDQRRAEAANDAVEQYEAYLARKRQEALDG